MSKRKNRDSKAMALIYVRYILPAVLCLVLVGLTFVPNLRYSIASGTIDEMSVAQRLDNDWYSARVALFGSSELSVLGMNFYRVLIVLIPALVLLFIIGFTSCVTVAAVAILYINSNRFRQTRERIWFIILIPNRIVVCVLQGLTLPVLFYSRIIVLLFERVYNTDVLLNVTFPEVWVFGLVFFALSVGLSAVSAKYERRLDADPFKKIAPPTVKVIERDDEEKREEPVFKTQEEREYYERQKRIREEQAERIRRLLNKDEEEK